MLYNVLPPLIFFASLGGIILVVSRVVFRLHRDQVTAQLRSHVSSVSKSKIHQVQDLAGILAPKQISVQSFKNRINYFTHAIRTSVVNTFSEVKAWRQKRRPVIKKDDAPTKTNISTNQKRSVTSPQSRYRELSAMTKATINSLKKVGRHKLTSVGRTITETLQQQAKLKTNLATKPAKKPIDPHSSPRSNAAIPTKKVTPTIKMVVTNNKTGPADEPNHADIKSRRRPQKEGRTTTPALSKLFQSNRPASVLDQAKRALQQAQTSRVEDLLVPHLAKHPQDTIAYMLLGQAAVSRQDWPEAIEVFEQVIRINPQTDGCYAALGKAAYKAGNLTRAIEALQKARNNNPQNTQVIKYLLKIATRMDNQPLQKSLDEELKILQQAKSPANHKFR